MNAVPVSRLCSWLPAGITRPTYTTHSRMQSSIRMSKSFGGLRNQRGQLPRRVSRNILVALKGVNENVGREGANVRARGPRQSAAGASAVAVPLQPQGFVSLRVVR